MTTRTRHHHRAKAKVSRTPDLITTKTHLTNAGHELWLAAEGLYSICMSYVEQKSTEKPYRLWIKKVTRLVDTISKSYDTITDFGNNMLKTSPVKQAAEKFANFKSY